MNAAQLDKRYHALAARLQAENQKALGIEETMQLAYAYNQVKFNAEDTWRRSLYTESFGALTEANDKLTRKPLEMQDGWAIDRSLSLPYLSQMLEDADRIIAEQRGARTKKSARYRSYFQNIWKDKDATRFPSFLNFLTSSDMLAVICNYLQTIPALSTTLPPGIRFVESNAAFDDRPDVAKDSQLFHTDYYSKPNVYVLVLLADTTFEHGPWTFFPKSTSDRAKQELGYWKRGKGYRMSDEEVYSVVDRSELIEFSAPRGTVLFIDSSACMHYGSRNSVKPRFQLMLGYSGVCRTDFSEVIQKPNRYPLRSSDPLLRQLIMDRYRRAPGQPSELDPQTLPPLMSVLDALVQPGELQAKPEPTWFQRLFRIR